jgi:hypothetical protein
MICVEKRQQELVDVVRVKRKYTKHNNVFWFEGGKVELAKKVPRMERETPTHPELVMQDPQVPQLTIKYSLTSLKKMSVLQLKAIITTELNQVLSSKKPRKADLIQIIQVHATQEN